MPDKPGYWANVAHIAAKEAASVVRWKDRQHAAVTLALAGVTMALTYLVVKDKGLAESIVYPILLGLAAVILIFSVAFIYHFGATPPRIAAAQVLAFSAELAPLKARVDELSRSAHDNAEYEQMAARVELLKSELDAATSENNKVRLTNIKDAITKHADEAPGEELFTPDKGDWWWQGAKEMLDDITPGASYKLFHTATSYVQMRRCVASLRRIAGDLQLRELRQH
jgi:outer membrane murein-binding lipoprotein Lpp